MANGSLARRYANALVELGREDSDVDRFGSDLKEMGRVLADRNRQLMGVLENPGITVGERKKVLAAVLERSDFHVYVKSFLQLLLDKNRFRYFFDILREYEAIADEIGHRVRATVTTSVALHGDLQAQVQHSLEQAMKRTVKVEFKVDPALIGGLVAQVGGKVFDASVRTRLQDITSSLLRNAAEA
jgi:F-type H+-transporting ATPase subunit delta